MRRKYKDRIPVSVYFTRNIDSRYNYSLPVCDLVEWQLTLAVFLPANETPLAPWRHIFIARNPKTECCARFQVQRHRAVLLDGSVYDLAIAWPVLYYAYSIQYILLSAAAQRVSRLLLFLCNSANGRMNRTGIVQNLFSRVNQGNLFVIRNNLERLSV